MKLGDLAFRPEDFEGKVMDLDLDGDRKFTLVYRDGECLADIANAILRERLKEALNIDELVNRFLAWSLPKSVLPDPCVMDQDYPHRSGTNLLTADEARQMFQYCIEEQGK